MGWHDDLTVRHITTYQHKQPVSGEQRMMLRPRKRPEAARIARITPKPTIGWIQDVFGNRVAIALCWLGEAALPAPFTFLNRHC